MSKFGIVKLGIASISITLALSGLSIVDAQAAAPGPTNWKQGSITLSGSTSAATGYRTGNACTSKNPVKNYDFWFEALNGTAKDNVYVRWVKCGETSTQDGESTVGGKAKEASYWGGWYEIGVNFKKDTCAQPWVRAKKASGTGAKFGYGQYFWYDLVP